MIEIIINVSTYENDKINVTKDLCTKFSFSLNEYKRCLRELAMCSNMVEAAIDKATDMRWEND